MSPTLVATRSISTRGSGYTRTMPAPHPTRPICCGAASPRKFAKDCWRSTSRATPRAAWSIWQRRSIFSPAIRWPGATSARTWSRFATLAGIPGASSGAPSRNSPITASSGCSPGTAAACGCRPTRCARACARWWSACEAALFRFDQKILSRGNRPGRFRLVLELDSGELAPSRLAHEVVELVRGEFVAHAFAPYVGDAVALGVGRADPGLVGQINAHAVGGAQARTLADQYGDRFGIEDLTDLIAHGHPALFDDHHGRNVPSLVIELPQHRVEERQGVFLDGESGEPVGDDEGRIEPA